MWRAGVARDKGGATAARPEHVRAAQIRLAARIFDLPAGENPGKRLLAIVESDGCFSDGIEVASGCSLGHRRLRLEDYGKIAATFVDTQTGRAVRIFPCPDARRRAYDCLPQEPRHYFAQLQAYQVLSDDELLIVQDVSLNTPAEQILSRPGVRVTCNLCGEEIINERELVRGAQFLCRACAGESYYQLASLAIHTDAK